MVSNLTYEGSSVSPPSEPTTYPVYRGFYILPSDPLTPDIVRVDFFCIRSSDAIAYENPQFLGSGDSNNGFYYIHTGLDENTFYAYWVQYVYRDGSKSPTGDWNFAGLAQLINSSNLNIDQLASKAYSTGLTTSGIYRGVIFQTSATDPRVQLDPTGLFATDANGHLLFQLSADGESSQLNLLTDLTEPLTFSTQPNSVNFTRLSDGGLAGQIYCVNFESLFSGTSFKIVSQSLGSGGIASTDFLAIDSSATYSSWVTMQSRASSGVATDSQLNAFADVPPTNRFNANFFPNDHANQGNYRLLIDGSGNSSFLQSADGVQQTGFEQGNVSVTVGTGLIINTQIIGASLGGVVATVQSTSNISCTTSDYGTWFDGSHNKGQFKINLFGTAGTYTVHYFAWG